MELTKLQCHDKIGLNKENTMKSFELEKAKYKKIKAVYCLILRCILKKCKDEQISPALATSQVIDSQSFNTNSFEQNSKVERLYTKDDIYEFAKEMHEVYPEPLIGTLIVSKLDGTIEKYENITYKETEETFISDGLKFWKQVYMDVAKTKSKRRHIRAAFDKLDTAEILLYDFSTLKLNSLIIFKSALKQKIYQEQNLRLKEELVYLYEMVKKYTISYKKYSAMKTDEIKEDASKHTDDGYKQYAANNIYNHRKENDVKSQAFNKQPSQKDEEKE